MDELIFIPGLGTLRFDVYSHHDGMVLSEYNIEHGIFLDWMDRTDEYEIFRYIECDPFLLEKLHKNIISSDMVLKYSKDEKLCKKIYTDRGIEIVFMK